MRKSRFWLFLFSLLPGCGQMYLGYSKRGVSLGLLFFGTIFLSSLAGLTEIGFLLPVLWFYSFFDAMNLYGKEEITDDWAFHLGNLYAKYIGDRRSGIIFGSILLVIGFLILLRNLVGAQLLELLKDTVFAPLIVNMPQLMLAVILIVLGIFLIGGKGRKSRNEE